MQAFTHKIKDQIGIHARPAGMIVKKAKEWESIITFHKGEKNARATQLMMLMGLGAKNGDVLEVTVEGPDEEDAARDMRAFLEEHL